MLGRSSLGSDTIGGGVGLSSDLACPVEGAFEGERALCDNEKLITNLFDFKISTSLLTSSCGSYRQLTIFTATSRAEV